MKKTILLTLTLLAGLTLARGASISLTNSDALGNSSFNAKGFWNSATAPGPGNVYLTGPNFRLRTPANTNSHAFQGDALTLNSTNGSNGGLMYKGQGTNGTITVTNLIFAGGWLHHQNGLGDLFQLHGNINVTADSCIWAKQGNINIYSTLSGTASITNAQPDSSGDDNRYVTLFGNNSGFTGRWIMPGLARLRITSEESLGGNPAAFAADQLYINGGWLATSNNVVLDDNHRGITVDAAGATFSVTNPDTNTPATLTIACPITGGGIVTKRGGGALTLSGNNDFSGGLNLMVATAGSRLNINSPTALGTGTFTLLSGGVAPAILDNTCGWGFTVSTGNAQSWSNSLTFLGSSGDLGMGSGPVTMYISPTVTVSNNTLVVGPLHDDGGGRALTKQGPGVLAITGGAHYTGNTVVNEGMLVLSDFNMLPSPAITIASGATLYGQAGLLLDGSQILLCGGTVEGSVTDNYGSIIAPGGATTAGTMTVNGDLFLGNGSTVEFNLSPDPTPGNGINDLVVVNGTLVISGPTMINITGIPTTGTYTLFQYSGGFSGDVPYLSVPLGYSLNHNTAAGTIELVVSHVPASLTWSGINGNVWDVAATANWNSGSAVFYTGDSVWFDDSGLATAPIILSGSISPLSVQVNASQDYDFTGAGILSGGLIKRGTGALILENNNLFSFTTIDGGILQVGNGGNGAGLGTGPIYNNAQLTFYSADNLTIAAPITGSGSISNLGGNVTLSGSFEGNSVTANGSGALVLSASNSFTGPAVALSGTLNPRNAFALGTDTVGTYATNGGQLFMDANVSFPSENLTLGGNALRKGGAGTTALGGTLTLVADTTILVDGGSTFNLTNAAGIAAPGINLTLAADPNGLGNVTAPIALGTGALTKSGSGTWTIAPTNTYTGKTFLNGGTLSISMETALGYLPGSSTADYITFGGGLLGVTTNAGVTAWAFADGLRGFTFGGDGGFNVGAGATLTIANDLAGTGNLIKGGPGLLILNGPNTLAGGLFIDRWVDGNNNDGITRVNVASAIQNITEIRSRNTSVGTAGGATLELNVPGGMTLPQPMFFTCRNNFTTPTVRVSGGDYTFSGATSIDVGGNVMHYLVDAGSSLTISGAMQYAGALMANRNFYFTGGGNTLVSGDILLSANGVTPVSVIKAGTATLTLGGANTYSGVTVVSNGVLNVTGSITTTGLVQVVAGTLTGTGLIDAPVQINAGGTLSPGASIGTLTLVNNLTLAGTTFVEINKSLGTRDLIQGLTNVNYGGALVVSNVSGTLGIGDTFTVFQAAAWSSNFASVTGTAGIGKAFAFDPATGEVSVIAAGIPTYPTNLTYSVSGNTLNLTWPASHQGWILQAQTNSLNVGVDPEPSSWHDVAGSEAATSADLAIDSGNPTVFFRLRYP